MLQTAASQQLHGKRLVLTVGVSSPWCYKSSRAKKVTKTNSKYGLTINYQSSIRIRTGFPTFGSTVKGLGFYVMVGVRSFVIGIVWMALVRDCVWLLSSLCVVIFKKLYKLVNGPSL
jgi:hypothetical protein